jgi:serine/threonine-protein kinase
MSLAPATEATIVASLGVPPPAMASLNSPQAMNSAAAQRAPIPAAPPTDAAAAHTSIVKPTALPAAPLPVTPPRESAKDKKARESREREARENEARVAAAALLVAPATGTVKIAISPWGLVEVDGASTGAAPPITELTLGEGRHQIVIRNGDNLPHTVTVNVIAGQTISVRHKFGS